MVGKTGVHSQGTLLQTTGFNRPGFPGMGCWVSYGLGSLNDNLPTFVVLPDHRGLASNGTEELGHGLSAGRAPGHGHLPRHAPTRSPILFPARQGDYITRASDAAGIELAGRLNRRACRPASAATPGSKPGFAATNWPRGCSCRARGARSLRGAGAYPEAVRARPRPDDVRQRDQPAGRDRLFCPQVPGRPAAAGARRAVRADLVGQRQRLSAPQLGLARGRRSATTARWPWAWPAARRP